MIHIQHAQTIEGKLIDFTLPSLSEKYIDATGLTALPALIDPHVHFRTPGMEHKEDWRTGAKAAIHGGYTTVFDMPNTLPPTNNATRLVEKNALIQLQLKEMNIPLRYHLFFGADQAHLDQIEKVKNDIIGIKVFMGCSTGNLVIDNDESLESVFSIAASHNLIVAVHAEDEHLIRKHKSDFKGVPTYHSHSLIRNGDVACRAVEKAIALTRRYKTRLYILHTSTREEIALIKKAKKEGLPVFAETTPHHLFLNDAAYQTLQGKAVVNPPLRSKEHSVALFEAIREGTIDTIGSDHAPHTLNEKAAPYHECPSGMPGIETVLPLLLDAHHKGLLSLKEIVSLTSARAREIFNLNQTDDIVLVDLNLEKKVDETTIKTKCGWSAYHGQFLFGWPVYTILAGNCYHLDRI